MSILIPGMKMPKGCSTCPFVDDDFMADDFGLICSLTNDKPQGNERLNSCPLIELPPHGDLIDVEVLIEGILGIAFMHSNNPSLVAINTENLLRLIDSLPTVIPAEEE